MPLYEYRCTKCGYRYEKIQKISDDPDTICSKCGAAVERPLSAPALQFKGAGWYVNDYAPKPATSSSTDKPAADSASTTESKPAAAESKPTAAEPASKPASTPSTT